MDALGSGDSESFWGDELLTGDDPLFDEPEGEGSLFAPSSWVDAGERQLVDHFQLDECLREFDSTPSVDDDVSSVLTFSTDAGDLDDVSSVSSLKVGRKRRTKATPDKEKKTRKRRRKPKVENITNQPLELNPKASEEEIIRRVKEQQSLESCPGKLCNKPKGHDHVCSQDLRKELGIDASPVGISALVNDIRTKVTQAEQDNATDFDKLRGEIEEDFKLLEKEMSLSTRRIYKEEVKEKVGALRRILDDFEYDMAEKVDCTEDVVTELEEKVTTAIDEAKNDLETVMTSAKTSAETSIQEYKQKVHDLGQALCKSMYVVSNRKRKPTDEALIHDSVSGTRFLRKRETKLVLEYIHGGHQGALQGARDYLFSNADPEFLDYIIKSYRGGRFLKEKVEKITKSYENSEEHMRKAVATIFGNHISRRKYYLMSKLQNLSYDPDTKSWVPRKAELDGVSYRMARSLPFNKIEQFVKSLNTGPVYQIPQHMGVSRTITSLSIMIIDLYLRVNHLKDELIWFNEKPYHFIMQFSDDGAPETKELTMSIGTLTCWNLGQKVRSRELQYFLHGLSVPEKAAIMSDIWRQHTNEMRVMEDSVFTVNGIKCTFSFEPSADMAWQSWAANEVGQQSTYFSPYGNVSLDTMSTMGGRLGLDENHNWKPWTWEARANNVEKLKKFMGGMKELGLREDVVKVKKREFMARNGIRQKGLPIIGKYAEQLRPEPLHCEINAWQHCLNLVYREVQRRGTLPRLLTVLSSPITGCTTGGSARHGVARYEEDVDMDRDENPEEETNARIVSSSLGRTTGNAPPESHGLHGNKDVSTSADRVMGIDSVNQLHQFEEPSKEDMPPPPIPSTPVAEVMGCGIPALAKQINEHRKDPIRRKQKLHFRLIGPQGIALARNWHRVCECLEMKDESPRDRVVRLALYQMGLCLREAGSLFQQSTTDEESIEKVDQLLRQYFNLHVLFFGPKSVTVTVWTMGYALPYHMKQLYEKFQVGYGITSMQSRESENAGIKMDLSHTNRSRSTTGTNGKWWQVCRWNYVRTFYLPEHEPIPSNYRPSFESRMPSFPGENICLSCGSSLDFSDSCALCDSSELKLISESSKLGTILPTLRKVLASDLVVEARQEKRLPSLNSFLTPPDINKVIDTDTDLSDLELTDLDLTDVEDALSDTSESLYHVMDISDAEDWDADSVFDLEAVQLAPTSENDFWEAVYQNEALPDDENADLMSELEFDF